MSKNHADVSNEKHPRWKGNDVGYKCLHDWVKRNKKKVEYCELCGEKKKLNLSNISGKYKRDLTDFRWLCRSCHNKVDGIGYNFKRGNHGIK